ncbi:AAA family ATPase [Helicobacter pylori]|nr:AAA family ATPase [Helicobacter pylori]MWR36290.1 AAA family ATPase [Helicobacter pylori]
MDDEGLVQATIDVSGYSITLEDLEARATFQEGDFVRVTPYSGDPQVPQTVKQLFRAGITCVVERLDWANAEVTLKAIPCNKHNDRYRLFSRSLDPSSEVCEHATLDESPSDYVAVRVDERLMGDHGAHIYRWFNPHTPEIPRMDQLSEEEKALYRQMAEGIKFSDGTSLTPDQIDAVLEGLETRVQLLQGPPGTGKTQVTAVAVLLRTLAHLSVGNVALVSAHTHTAVDNLLERIAVLLPAVAQAAASVSLSLPKITLIKVHSSPEQMSKKPLEVAEEVLSRAPGLEVRNEVAESCASAVKGAIDGSVVIIGGTTGTLLKMAKYLNSRNHFPTDPNAFKRISWL